MIRIGASDAFWYPVRVAMVGDDGRRVEHEFKARFKRLSRSDFAALIERLGAGAVDDLSLVREALLDWRDVQNEAGEALEFTPAHRDALLEVWPVLPALAAAYIEAHTPEGRRKN